MSAVLSTPEGTLCPVQSLLPDILTALQTNTRLVLSAPPGAGKTTRVPLALLDATWRGNKKIIVLEPRRLAAKSAARHMASLLGEKVGQRVGYAMRLEQCHSAATRVEVVTEGVLTRMLQDDPELNGIACILFDEFHERSLHADTGLALCLECQEAFRPDLRLLVMSATLETDAVADLLSNCPVLISKGRAFPVAIRYTPVPRHKSMEEHMADLIRHILHNEQGSILAFLPGMREIRRVQDLLESSLPDDTQVMPLHGMLPAAAQDAAIAPLPPPQRKVVLATALAETSLTIKGVRLVIDSGLARSARFDTGSGMSHLVTTRVSLAQAQQRTGRAGRTEPGICYRLWDAAEEISFIPFSRPEICDADLCPLLLQLTAWGVTDARTLHWLTPPPESALQLAAASLRSLHAIDTRGALTTRGRDMLHLPVHPRLGAMLLSAVQRGLTPEACLMAALLEKRGPVPQVDSNLNHRLHVLCSGGSPAARRTRQSARQLFHIITRQTAPATFCSPLNAAMQSGLLVAQAWPEWIGQNCGNGQFRLRCGRMAVMQESDSLAREPFLAVAALHGDNARSRILLASPLSRDTLESTFAEDIAVTDSITWDARTGMVQARHRRLLGSLVLEETPLTNPAPEAILTAMLEGVRTLGSDCLPWTEDLRQWQARVLLARCYSPEDWPDVSDTALMATLEDWLAPFLSHISRADRLRDVDLAAALHTLLSWDKTRRLDKLCPTHLMVPSGSSIRVNYLAPHTPVLAVKLQEVFGWEDSPSILEGKVKLCLHLNSPAGRPLQVTQDLRHFWLHGYTAVRREMRGRYPKHPWPEAPLTATATRFTNKILTKGHS